MLSTIRSELCDMSRATVRSRFPKSALFEIADESLPLCVCAGTKDLGRRAILSLAHPQQVFPLTRFALEGQAFGT